MDFPTVEYMDWFRNYWHDIDCDLATSGLHPVSQKELDIVLGDLNFGKTLLYGHPRFVELISEIYGVDKKEILTTSGATHANFLISTLLIEEGDEVIVEHPVYTPLLDLVSTCKAKVKLLKRKFEEKYELNLSRLNEMVSKNTKMIVITNLHNPSGNRMDQKALKAVGEIAEDNGSYVLSDEVYKDFMLEDMPPTISSFTKFGITTGSLSKFYGAGGLRAGWATCAPDIIDKLRKLNDYLLVANSNAAENYGALILENRKFFVEKVKKITSQNLPIVNEWVKSRNDLEWVPPEYGVIGFPRILADIDSMKLSEQLLKKYRTMLPPGRFFGVDDHIRIGFGGEEEMLRKGLENIGSVIDEIG
jgi:aspartate/methionine/tyrosine aminotransferase